MRCPKCGYISFDHLEHCLKCKKDISVVSNTLHGTVFNVVVPSFLNLRSRGDRDSADNEGVVENLETDNEFNDDDFEVLEDDEFPMGSEAVAADGKDDDFPQRTEKISGDDEDSEDREIEIDLSQFESKEKIEEIPTETKLYQQEPEARTLSIELPEELEDLSDLAPPSKIMHSEKSESESIAEQDDANSKMDDLDFDLVFGDLETDLTRSGSGSAKETTLALDGIDFSEPPAKSRAKAALRPSGADMDEDLNFDLDLGGLSIHKDL